MVRFKNRYILLELSQNTTQKNLFKFIKNVAQEMLGELFLSKISFSLQIKYCSQGWAVVRVPRQHCQSLCACLFTSKPVKIQQRSGTIKNIQKRISAELRKSLGRQLTQKQEQQLKKIDYT